MSISRPCWFSATKQHTGSDSVRGPGDSCGHHREERSQAYKSEGLDSLLWIVLSPGQVSNFQSLCLTICQQGISTR